MPERRYQVIGFGFSRREGQMISKVLAPTRPPQSRAHESSAGVAASRRDRQDQPPI
jgi:hypothetical protein